MRLWKERRVISAFYPKDPFWGAWVYHALLESAGYCIIFRSLNIKPPHRSIFHVSKRELLQNWCKGYWPHWNRCQSNILEWQKQNAIIKNSRNRKEKVLKEGKWHYSLSVTHTHTHKSDVTPEFKNQMSVCNFY